MKPLSVRGFIVYLQSNLFLLNNEGSDGMGKWGFERSGKE